VANWTIFINKKHSIAHVVPKAGGFWTRIKMNGKMKNETDNMVEMVLYFQLAPYLIGV
jgi:hypothetical protein